ncbi:MAG TPA: hypothetical protein VIJ26_13040 [Thermoanaerobaculia bacterium]
MADTFDMTINVQVTPPSETDPQWGWNYEVLGVDKTLTPFPIGGTEPPPLFCTATSETQGTITIDLQPNDICTFQESQPLTFYTDWTMETPAPEGFPEWYTIDSVAGSALQFSDSNHNLHDRTYYFRINATYNSLPIRSPDPTIVNAGVDGPPNNGMVHCGRTYHFPVKHSGSCSPEQQEPKTAAA